MPAAYRFLSDAVYKAGPVWPRFDAGRVYWLDENFGERWVRRHVAVRDDDAMDILPDPRFPDRPVHSRRIVSPPAVEVSAPPPAPDPAPVGEGAPPRLIRGRRGRPPAE